MSTPATPPDPQPAEQPAAGATATAPRPQADRPKVDQLPPFKVLLHNDDVNSFEDVVQAILELTPLQRTRALEVMLEAHQSGVALVLVTHKEAAELYQDRFLSKRLTVTIEPA